MVRENKGLAKDKDLEQGMVSKTPPHCQILKLISKFSPALSLFNSRNRLQEDVVVHCKRMPLAFAICMLCVAGGDRHWFDRDTQALARPLDICVSPRHQPCYRSTCSFIFSVRWSSSFRLIQIICLVVIIITSPPHTSISGS